MGDPRNERIDEVAADLAELRREAQTGFSQVRTEIAEVRTEVAEIRTEVAEVRTEVAEVRTEVTQLRAEFGAEQQRTRAGFAAVRAEFAAEQERTRTELRRHFDVVAEDLRGMIRLLAEGLSAVHERMDRFETRFETRMAEQFAELRDLIRLSYTDLDGRVRVLEGRAGA